LNAHRQAGSLASIPPYIWAYMVIIVLLWGFTSTVEVLTLRRLSPILFTAWSTVYGAAGILIYNIFSGRIQSLLTFRPIDHAVLFILSMLGYAAYFLLKYAAYTLSPIPQANILHYTFTVFIVIFSIPILNQKISFWKIIGVASGFCGAALIISGGTFTSFAPAHIKGYLCALGAGASFGLFSVLSEKASFDRISSIFYFHAYSAFVLLLILIQQGNLIVPSGIKEISGVFYNGFIANGVGIFLWLSAQSSTDDVSLLTSILYLVPFISLLCFKVFLHMQIPGYAYLGLILIVGGMIVHNIRSRHET